MRKIHRIATLIIMIAALFGCNAEKSPEPAKEPVINEAVPENKGNEAGHYENAEPSVLTEPPKLDEIPVSRALTAKMLALMELSIDEIEEMPVNIEFTDVKAADWHFKYINAAASLKYMFGGDTGLFEPERPLTIYEAQLIIDRLNPNNKTQIKITPETKSLAISYALWNQLYVAALEELAGEKTPEQRFGLSRMELIVLATPANVGALPPWSMVTDKGAYFYKGIEMNGYLDKKIAAYTKQNEIAFITEIIDTEPVIEGAFVREGGSGYIEVFAGGAQRSYKLAETLEIASEIADVKIAGQTAKITAFHTGGVQGDFIRAMENQIEFSDGKMEAAGNIPVYSVSGGKPVYKGANGLKPGANNAGFYLKDGRICAAVISEKTEPRNIRVLITSSDYRMTVHTSVKISSDADFTVITQSGEKKFKKGEVLTFDKENNADLFSSDRISVKPEGGGLIELQSVKRGDTAPRYRGTIEVSREGEAFVIVNELDFEEYLYSVVSSQIPETLGLTAAKAQAVIARSCAYSQFEQSRFAYYGANVDDSTKSQLYNASIETETSVQAVNQTKGEFLSYNGEVIRPQSFLASAGSTANSGEVWQKTSTAKFPSATPDYLRAAKQYQSGDFSDLSNEASAAEFFKAQNVDAFEKGGLWFRWSVRMEKADIEASINANIKERYNSSPSQVLTLAQGGYARLPVNGIGELVSLEVVKRGAGGNIMEMKAVGTNGEYLFKTESCIRTLIRPYQYDLNGQSIILVRGDGSKIENYQSMPSAFYVFDVERGGKGEILAVNFYGGGNGHGVGMSQMGASALAEAGVSYENILKHYFGGAKLEKRG